jgi:hypothetical protein
LKDKNIIKPFNNLYIGGYPQIPHHQYREEGYLHYALIAALFLKLRILFIMFTLPIKARMGQVVRSDHETNP